MVYLGKMIVLKENWEDACHRIVKMTGTYYLFIHIKELAVWNWDLYYVGTPIASVPILKIDVVLPVFTCEDDLFYLVFREETVLAGDKITDVEQNYGIDRKLPISKFAELYAKRRIVDIVKSKPLDEIFEGCVPIQAKWEYDVRESKKKEVKDNE